MEGKIQELESGTSGARIEKVNLMEGAVGNFNQNSQPVRNKINRENTRQRKKQSHAQNNIYVVRQFAYVHGIAGISLLSRKIQ